MGNLFSISKWPSILRGPTFLTILTVLILFTGGYASLYSGEIKNAFPLVWDFQNVDTEISYKALIFWVLAIIVSIMYYLKEKEKSNYEESIQKELIKKINSLPPRDFLVDFDQIMNVTWGMYNGLDDKSSEEDIKDLIRGILLSICKIAKKFDPPSSSGKEVRYSASIMSYIPSDGLDENARNALEKIMYFSEDNVCIDKLDGLLLLRKDLSGTLTGDQANYIDNELEELCLPVAKKKSVYVGSLEKTNILPGAPEALVEGALRSFEKTSKLYDYCESNVDLTVNVKKKIKEYFRSKKGKMVRSFVSIPIQGSRNDDRKVGVINIHKDSEEILINEERAETFWFIIKPLVYMLLNLLDRVDSDGKISLDLEQKKEDTKDQAEG